MIDPSLKRAALNRLRGEGLGFATVLVGESGPNDLDGMRWKVVATDGKHTEIVEAELTGSQGVHVGDRATPEAIQRAVEKRATGRFPAETRVADLVAASPITLFAEDLV